LRCRRIRKKHKLGQTQNWQGSRCSEVNPVIRQQSGIGGRQRPNRVHLLELGYIIVVALVAASRMARGLRPISGLGSDDDGARALRQKRNASSERDGGDDEMLPRPLLVPRATIIMRNAGMDGARSYKIVGLGAAVLAMVMMTAIPRGSGGNGRMGGDALADVGLDGHASIGMMMMVVKRWLRARASRRCHVHGGSGGDPIAMMMMVMVAGAARRPGGGRDSGGRGGGAQRWAWLAWAAGLGACQAESAGAYPAPQTRVERTDIAGHTARSLINGEKFAPVLLYSRLSTRFRASYGPDVVESAPRLIAAFS
jgi:hypothetical protein